MSHGYAAHGNHGSPGIKSLADVFLGLDATAKVDGKTGGLGNGAQHTVVNNVLGLGTVKVYDVQTPEAQLLKAAGHFYGVIAVHLLGIVVALGKPYALPMYNVYCRNELYHRLRKLCNICSPTLPLFTGWNWVA